MMYVKHHSVMHLHTHAFTYAFVQTPVHVFTVSVYICIYTRMYLRICLSIETYVYSNEHVSMYLHAKLLEVHITARIGGQMP